MKNVAYLAILILVFLPLCMASSEDEGLADSPWPKFQRDLQNTGRSPYIGAQDNVLRFTISFLSLTPAVIGSDDTIYFGVIDGNLYAVAPDNTVKWFFETLNNITSSSAIGSNSTIYFGTYSNIFYALYDNGDLKWSFETNGPIYSSPGVGDDGTIYFGSWENMSYTFPENGPPEWFGTGKFYAIIDNGDNAEVKWVYPVGGLISSSPAIASDGTIYFGSNDNKLYALNPNGTEKWNFETGGRVYSPALSTDGTIYFGSNDNKLYALNPDNSLKWVFEADGGAFSPSIGPDGTVYVSSGDNRIYALDTNGALKWSFSNGFVIISPQAIGADGTIYFGSHDNKVYALNPDGTLKWSFETGYLISASPVIGADGAIYVGSWDGNLYVIGTPIEQLQPDNTLLIAAGVSIIIALLAALFYLKRVRSSRGTTE